MTGPAYFLDVATVLAVHRRVIEEHGGDPSLRDRAMLESAVRMPRATFEGKLLHRTIPEMAAAYLFHLCMNHPFIDGNKRVALASAEVFLDLNAMELVIDDEATYSLVMGVARGATTKAEVVSLLAKHCRRL